MRKIEVVAAYFENDGKYLIAQRLKGSLEDKWEFPGGKIDPGETPKQALKREIKEELNLDIVLGKKLTDVSYSYPEIDVKISLYNVNSYKGDMVLTDHKQVKWIKPSEAKKYTFAPADQDIVEKLMQLKK